MRVRPEVRAGFRRLYDAVGCSLVDREELAYEFAVGADVSGRVYFGPNPQFGIAVISAQEGFVVPASAVPVQVNFEYKANAAESSYPRQFFCEVVTSVPIEVPAQILSRAHEDVPEINAELQRLAQGRREDLVIAADLIAGLIGLQLQPQFLKKVINENDVVMRPGSPILQFNSDSIELLNTYRLNEVGVDRLGQLFSGLAAVDRKAALFAGNVLGWLLRDWSQQDRVNKFVALFIPLEMILDGYSEALPQATLDKARAVRQLLAAYGGEQSQPLLALFNQTMTVFRPPLVDRFALLAEEAKLPHWKSDVEAFRTFNRMRNNLIHRGDARVVLSVSVTEEDLWSLEDIVERYVSFALLRSGDVYPSRWRPARDKPS